MAPVATRLVAILMLVATAGLLAACGGSGHSAGTTTVHPAVATHAQIPPLTSPPTSAVKPLTKPQAIAIARAINLTPADVPGFKVTARQHEHETAAEKQLKRKLLGCTGGALNSRSGLAEASSKNFKLEQNLIHLSVSSEVSVARTPAPAIKELPVIRSKHVRACISHYLGLLLESDILKGQKRQPGLGPISISISQGTPPAPGATESFWWRITANVTVHNIKLPFYIDMLGFVYGPTEVSLLSSGALKPFPATIQENLYRLLLKRAKAHTS
jgi:hypothetical protein